MATPNCNWSEVIAGLGASGANIIVAAIGDHPRQGHPFIPVLQVSDAPQVIEMYADDLDGVSASRISSANGMASGIRMSTASSAAVIATKRGKRSPAA
jgi:altronate dehydratase